ncbi:pentatricopeptide repeat-containing protein At3g22690-like [Syzygium oleosum]|uniref:pentatricopeptide repeat-containing protein At3g22690-like n=1 Tax=Syzygium oleosum TaxID=219896 RepID=UPI0024B9ABA4|nr:pentatricopeptide repeat-containing protein At3g22690-like [Syzygium oleosum]
MSDVCSAMRFYYDEMMGNDVAPNHYTFPIVVKGFVAIGPVLDLVGWNSMIDGHVKNREVDVARELFDEMIERDVFISWNTLLALYVHVKGYTKRLSLFDSMLQEEEIKPNRVTLVSVFTTCANTWDLNKGHLVYSYMKDNDIEVNVLLSTALLTMYAKCGTMDLARKVFDQMPNRSVVSWNAMIMGMARKPWKCWWCFNLMSRVYNIQPKVKHYGCMVNLLARAGLVMDSGELFKEVPIVAGSSLWGALLSARRTHSHMELREMVAEHLIEFEPTDVEPYVLLSNMYAAKGSWDAVENVKIMMKAKGSQKEVRSRLIELGGIESTESAKDGMHHQRIMIYSMLSEIGSQTKVSCRDSTAVEDPE